MTTHPSRTRIPLALATLATVALTASGCGGSNDAQSAGAGSGTPSGSASTTPHDTTAVRAGATWLSSQVTHGAVHNDQYDTDDYGLGIDVALALHAVDQQPATVRAISDRLAQHVKEYTAPGYGTVTSAGGTAKAVVLAQAAGADPTSYGGTDLVAQLERTVADRGPAAGRIQDVLDPKEASAADYANVVGQAYAVEGLTAAGSPEAAAATTFLLAQQCQGGWFRLGFTKDSQAPDQGCDADRTSKPDLDTTAFAVQALGETDSAQATAAVDSAVAWLERQQAPDGSFGGGATGTPNTNSTGLAGTALAGAGDPAAAEKAATWVFGHQVLDCRKFSPAVRGVIAYDDAGLTTAASKGISVKAEDQFRRASAGALPVLQWLPASATTDQRAGSC